MIEKNRRDFLKIIILGIYKETEIRNKRNREFFFNKIVKKNIW